MTEYGHRKMRVWQNIDRLGPMVNRLVRKIPRIEYKLIRQINSAFDSAGANFVEGYYSGSIREYKRFVNYSKRSFAEVHERLKRSSDRFYFSKNEYGEFEDWAIKTMYLYDRLIFSLERKIREEEEGSRGLKKVEEGEEGKEG